MVYEDRYHKSMMAHGVPFVWLKAPIKAPYFMRKATVVIMFDANITRVLQLSIFLLLTNSSFRNPIHLCATYFSPNSISA